MDQEALFAHFADLDARFLALKHISGRSLGESEWAEVQAFLDPDEFLLALQTYVGIVIAGNRRIPAAAYAICVELVKKMEARDELDPEVLLPLVDP